MPFNLFIVLLNTSVSVHEYNLEPPIHGVLGHICRKTDISSHPILKRVVGIIALIQNIVDPCALRIMLLLEIRNRYDPYCLMRAGYQLCYFSGKGAPSTMMGPAGMADISSTIIGNSSR